MTNPEKKSSIPETKAVEIALQEVAKRDSWDSTQVYVEIDSLNNGFRIIIRKIPESPGNFRQIEVSDAGKIISYRKGK